MKRQNFKHTLGTASAVALMSFALGANAAEIVNEGAGTPAIGTSGWNTDNIKTECFKSNDTLFNCANWLTEADVGAYFLSGIYDGDPASATKLGTLAGKDYPVGEPDGIKIVSGDTSVDAPKPENCILTSSYLEGAYLDSGSPDMTICSSPFQSHKRYKIRMLPSTVAGGAGAEKGIDLVFNVEDGADTSYQVFQKINNWTDSRLAGFKLELGFEIGSSFQAASATAIGTDELNVTVNHDIWAFDELATFSHGLFGPPDQHFPPPGGYFDNDTKAGYQIDQFSASVTTAYDNLTSGSTLGSTYQSTTGVTGQFGNWLPYSWIPQGIFFDDDGNPETDALLMAWWGDDGTGNYAWLQGEADGFAPVDEATVAGWLGNPAEYETGGIEDLVNIGLNYVVNIPDLDITDWPTYNADYYGTGNPGASFTIRITPILSTDQTVPGYMDPANAPDLPDTGDTNGGSGGCTIGTGSAWNITMPAILLALLGYGLIRRRRKQ